MKMIGNDVIDLEIAKAESNWRRKGYLSKIFTNSEQLMISRAENPDVTVWSLWSRKEAAYKIYNRQTKIRAYNPLQFECSEMEYVDGHYFGKVQCAEDLYHTKTEISIDSIHSIAVKNKIDFENIEYLKNSSIIQKTDGIPERFDGLVLKPVSISHHGRFKKIISI